MMPAYKTLATGTSETFSERAVIWDKFLRVEGLGCRAASHRAAAYFAFYLRAAVVFFLLLAAIPSPGREKDVLQYGAGLIVNIPLPEPEVRQVVEDVAQNTIIRGTKEYNKDEFVAGATAVLGTPVFPAWTEGGKVFYKVRLQALDPRNFKNGGDVGTLAVRYVVQPQGDKNTILRIDALFVEDFRRSVHQSNGSVESAEYKDIQDRLAAVELIKRETAEALEAKQEQLAKKKFGLGSDTVVLSTPPLAGQSNSASGYSESAPGESTNSQVVSPSDAAQSAPAPPMPQPPAAYEQQPGESLEHHVAGLRRELARRVKQPGAPLQSAPFHTATKLKSLEPGTEVLILISTPYWYGVETHDGEHGWIRRDQLEQAP
jgi:hypothetical protein